MLIHGRLVLTSSGLMLDEVRSLLQKALRRKELSLVLASCSELIGQGKDQLPWKSLVTFLFEDHCLSDPNVLAAVYSAYTNKNKYRAVEVLLQAHTCRVAACLPVIALNAEYHPKMLQDKTDVPKELQGLLTPKNSNLNFDLILAHIQAAWVTKDEKKLIAAVKLASLVDDYEERTVTQKGLQFLIEAYQGKRKPSISLLVLSAMFKVTQDPNLRRYIYYCFKFAMVPDTVTRLLMFSPVVYLLYRDKVKSVNVKSNEVDWSTAGRLTSMPGYAVDKHTFRGKFGKGTKHLTKKKPLGMSDQEYDEFHGMRPKRDIRDFFSEGVKCSNETLSDNPYWECTKEVYLKQTPKLQKTLHMSKLFYGDLRKDHRTFFHSNTIQVEADLERKDSEMEKNRGSKSDKRGMKRTLTCSSDDDFDCTKPKAPKIARVDDVLNKSVENTKLVAHAKQPKSKPLMKNGVSNVNVDKKPVGPLLQLPTSYGKAYTCLDTTTNSKVWKGPYKAEKMGMALFYHKTMREVFNDPHTLEVESQGHHLVFPLLKAPGSAISITKKDFFDLIQKKDIKDGEFVLRESLGVIQLHKLPLTKIRNLPVTIWAHFLYRFCLNVGDSGLYNAVTDADLTFLFGIDMEENRGSIKSKDLIGLMFVKPPAKAILGAVKRQMKSQLAELVKIFSQAVNYKQLDLIATKYGANFDRTLFETRLEMVKKALATF